MGIEGETASEVSSSDGSCYMCSQPATSNEHAPAKCFFPEINDDPERRDFRKNLITVPSCDTHNSQKSGDDEYLRFHIVSMNGLNDHARRMVATKIVRGLERRPGLGFAMFQDASPAFLLDSKNNQWVETRRVKTHGPRVDKALDHLARALYYHLFRKKWLTRVQVLAHFLTYDDPEVMTVEVRRTFNRVFEMANSAFANVPRIGDNPVIFNYQVVGDDTGRAMVRFTLYEGAVVTLLFPDPD
jgi:hypothetical protein